ncbi:uncharacterized protein [Coffea arabica]|uniref:Uncharacterized protein n=1 Tax=Coffea arabica TaxID=13443 RepID=A0A6P6SC10_COFAR|nr:uncharacterized protein LOC113690097 [Coffea arabica]
MPMPVPLEENFNDNTTSGGIIKEDGVAAKESAFIPTADTGTATTVVPSMNKNGKMNINNNRNKEEEEEKKKKKRPLGFFRAALMLLRSDSKSKKKPPPAPDVVDPDDRIHSKTKWEKMVGSMRPLHLQDNRSLSPASPPRPGVESLESEDLIYNNSSAMMSIHQYQPSSPSPSTVSSGGTMSQYASASNLQELEQDYYQGNDDDDPDEVFDALCGDEMIDAKAEEFIAQFYQQMKLQQIN